MHPLITAYLRKRELERMPTIELARFHTGEYHALMQFVAELQIHGR